VFSRLAMACRGSRDLLNAVLCCVNVLQVDSSSIQTASAEAVPAAA
jgi:hypothetical protein